MTTPRDAIGLSERLRHVHRVFSRAHTRQITMTVWSSDVETLEEAATALDALHKELAQTQAHLAIRNGDLAEAVRERDSIQERVKELEAADRYANLISIIADIREKSGLGGYPMLSELADAIGSKLADAESRATSAEQERDEALERLKPFAYAAESLDESHLDRMDLWESPSGLEITAGHLRAARDLVRRLAAGTEKEKRE